MSINKRRFAKRHQRIKREVYISPEYDSIKVGDKIVVHSGHRNYKVTVLSSTKTQIRVHIIYHENLDEVHTYSKTTGKRIRCNDWDTRDSIVMRYNPYRLMTWEDVDEAIKATEDRQRMDAKAKWLNTFNHQSLNEDQLDQAIALIKSFDKEV